LRRAPSNKALHLTIRRGLKGRYPSVTVVIYSRLAGERQRYADYEALKE
jgi:hypothetical protein